MAVRVTRIVAFFYVATAALMLLAFASVMALSDDASPAGAGFAFVIAVAFPLLIGWALWKEGGTARSIFAKRGRR